MSSRDTILRQVKEFLDAAPTPEDRNIRKMWLHGFAYGVGPQKFEEALKQFRGVKIISNKKD